VLQGRYAGLLNDIKTGKGLTLLAEGQLLVQPVCGEAVESYD
jgi:hypothetical protein